MFYIFANDCSCYLVTQSTKNQYCPTVSKHGETVCIANYLSTKVYLIQNIQNIHFSQPEDEANKLEAKSDADDKLKKENTKSESGAHLYKSSNIAFDTLLHSEYDFQL